MNGDVKDSVAAKRELGARPADGGPAFPLPEQPRGWQVPSNTWGMSLRDYFAAKAMQAILGKTPLVGVGVDVARLTGAASVSAKDARLAREGMAHGAFAVADAMLAEREKS